MQYPLAILDILVSSCMWATSAWILNASHLLLHEAEMPLPISEILHLLFTYQGDVSRRRRGELSYHMFWFLWEAKVEHGSNIRMCGACMQSQVKQKLSDWADAGPAGLNTAAGSELQFLLSSCDELSSVDTAHPRCLAASHSHHMDIVLLYRNVAGSKGFGGGRHRIDNWSNLLHHAGFLLKNGKMAKICMVATSQMPGSIIKLSQYYHTTITTPHSSQTCKNHPSIALLRPHIYMMTCSIEIYI